VIDEDYPISPNGRLLVPVGMPLGFFSLATPSELGDEIAEVRRGEARHQMVPELYEFWTASAALATRARIADWATEHEVSNIDQALADLIEIGLVIELNHSPEANAELLGEHRLLPVGYGLGNTSEKRTVFYVAGQNGDIVHSMSSFSFSIWSLSDGYTSVQQACETSAELFGLDLDLALEGIAVELAAMVANGAAILDVVGQQPPTVA
jgi:hypothetical protein